MRNIDKKKTFRFVYPVYFSVRSSMYICVYYNATGSAHFMFECISSFSLVLIKWRALTFCLTHFIRLIVSIDGKILVSFFFFGTRNDTTKR